MQTHHPALSNAALDGCAFKSLANSYTSLINSSVHAVPALCLCLVTPT